MGSIQGGVPPSRVNLALIIPPCHTAAILSRDPKDLCFTTPSLAVETMGVRLGVVKQSFFGLLGQYGRRVTRANGDEKSPVNMLHYMKSTFNPINHTLHIALPE